MIRLSVSRVQAVNTSFRVCVSVCVMVVGGGVGELQTPGLDVKASCRGKKCAAVSEPSWASN